MEWVLTRDKLIKLLDDCQAVLKYERNPGMKDVKKEALKRFHMEEWNVNRYNDNFGYYFFQDIHKVLDSIVVVMSDIDDEDVEYHIRVS